MSALQINPLATPNAYNISIALSGGTIVPVDIQAVVAAGARTVVIQGDDLDAVRVAFTTTGTTPGDPAVPTTASSAAHEFVFVPSHGLTLTVGPNPARITDLKFRAEVASAVVLTIQAFA